MRSEKGAITLYVTVVCLFVLIIGTIAYIGTSNRQAVQLAALKKIEEQYNDTNLTSKDLYLQYDGGDIVPVYTPEQFTKVGSGEEVYVEQTGKIYTFSTDKTYMFYGAPEDFNNLLVTMQENVKEQIRISLVGEAVTATAMDVSVLEGEDHKLSEYFSYNETEEDAIASVVYTDTCHADENVTNTKYLAEGTHKIKCTVTKTSGTVSNAVKDITIASSGLATQNTVIKPSSSSNVQIVIPKGFAPAILENGTTTSSPWTSGKVLSLMPKEEWNNITKGFSWDFSTGTMVITCSDGIVE